MVLSALPLKVINILQKEAKTFFCFCFHLKNVFAALVDQWNPGMPDGLFSNQKSQFV
jgi:hypothetical protein